jgi:ATP-dependent exoDNAse (exonuclease V) alpha subunit
MEQSTALALLKSGKNVFLTGSAGTGKTYVLNQYVEYLKERKVPVAVTASTGIAATHMNGQTIHSWSGIGVKDDLTRAQLLSMKDKKYMNDKLLGVKVLIIDEISMLHKTQLDLVNRVLKFFKQNTLPFGGIQVVFSGDFFQLPPVGEPHETNKDKFAFMSQAWLDASLTICYLTEQFRQTDNELNSILNGIRTGEIDKDKAEMLQSRIGLESDSEILPAKLYSHNMDVDRVNREFLNDIEGKEKLFKATTKGNAKLVESLKSSVLAEETLKLKVGAKVMFVRNNYEKGYMNGTVGEVSGYSDKGFPKVKMYNGRKITAEPEKWEIEDEKGKSLASFNQIPLRLAWAITVHKSQGMTLDTAEIDLSKTFERGQGYVALSRLKDLEGLYLKGINRTALEVSPLALKADLRFQELSMDAENALDEDNLEEEFKRFLILAGGLTNAKEVKKNKSKIKEKKGPKRSTYEITYELILKGTGISEIAEERGMAESTIVGHLVKINELYPDTDLNSYKPKPEVLDRVKEVKGQLSAKGEYSTKDLFEKLGGKVSYQEIKLAMLFI